MTESSPTKLLQLLERTREIGFTIASEPGVGALLRVLAASKRGADFLELGTGTGIGTCWILDGMDEESRLTTVDSNLEVQQTARDLLGEDPRVLFVHQDGADFLRGSNPESYDLVFADAIPGKFECVEEALSSVRIGGFYVVDDTIPREEWPEGQEARLKPRLESLANDRRFVCVPIEWSSGIVVAVRVS